MDKYNYLDEIGCVDTLQSWHTRLDENRGDRARLRRAERAEDVLLTDAFYRFLQTMPHGWRDESRIFSAAAVAGLLSHVRENHQPPSRKQQDKKDKEAKRVAASFAEQLGTPVEGQKRPYMSELRFQQLLKSRTTDEFYRNVRRAVQLLGGRVNILSLANDIIQWHKEFDRQIDRRPSKRLAVRWATDYFSVLPQE